MYFQDERGELIFAFRYYKFNLMLYFLLSFTSFFFLLLTSYIIYVKLSLN